MAKKKKSDARPFWTADCETDPFKNGRVPRPFIWGLWTGVTYHEFKTPEEFADYIRDSDVIIYFHNGGKFDIYFLLAMINLCEEIKVISGRLVVAHIGKAEIRDSWNILPVPLAAYKKDSTEALAQMLRDEGEDPKIADDYQLMEAEHRAKPGVFRVIRHYLKNDCLFLYELIEAFEKREGRHLTIAGAAMARWRRMTGIRAPESDRNYYQYFAQWYSGGRVECFQKGIIDGPVTVIDIRSAYMWAMQYKHPWGTKYITTVHPRSWKPHSFLTVECVSMGCLPMRGEKGSLSFPDDNVRRTYYVCGHELDAGIETGSVRDWKVLKSNDFQDEIDFKDYVDYCHGARMLAREEEDKAGDIIEKLFGNSLYGKWSSNPDNYGNFICVPFDTMEDYRIEGWEFDGLIGPHALMRKPLEEWQSHFLNVATAASITSMVRAKLWRAIKASDTPYYSDTDSLFCRGAGDVEFGEQLGMWKNEGVADRLYLAGKKMYLCEGGDFKKEPKVATKGVKLSAAHIKRVCAGETILYEPKVPTFSVHKEPVFTARHVRMT